MQTLTLIRHSVPDSKVLQMRNRFVSNENLEEKLKQAYPNVQFSIEEYTPNANTD